MGSNIKEHKAGAALLADTTLEVDIQPLVQAAAGMTKKVNNELDSPFKVIVMAGKMVGGSKSVIFAKYLCEELDYPAMELHLDNIYEDGQEAIEMITAWAKLMEIKDDGNE